MFLTPRCGVCLKEPQAIILEDNSLLTSLSFVTIHVKGPNVEKSGLRKGNNFWVPFPEVKRMLNLMIYGSS